MKKILIVFCIALIGLGMWVTAFSLMTEEELPAPESTELIRRPPPPTNARLALGFGMIGGGVLGLVVFARR